MVQQYLHNTDVISRLKQDLTVSKALYIYVPNIIRIIKEYGKNKNYDVMKKSLQHLLQIREKKSEIDMTGTEVNKFTERYIKNNVGYVKNGESYYTKEQEQFYEGDLCGFENSLAKDIGLKVVGDSKVQKQYKLQGTYVQGNQPISTLFNESSLQQKPLVKQNLEYRDTIYKGTPNQSNLNVKQIQTNNNYGHEFTEMRMKNNSIPGTTHIKVIYNHMDNILDLEKDNIKNLISVEHYTKAKIIDYLRSQLNKIYNEMQKTDKNETIFTDKIDDSYIYKFLQKIIKKTDKPNNKNIAGPGSEFKDGQINNDFNINKYLLQPDLERKLRQYVETECSGLWTNSKVNTIPRVLHNTESNAYNTLNLETMIQNDPVTFPTKKNNIYDTKKGITIKKEYYETLGQDNIFEKPQLERKIFNMNGGSVTKKKNKEFNQFRGVLSECGGNVMMKKNNISDKKISFQQDADRDNVEDTIHNFEPIIQKLSCEPHVNNICSQYKNKIFCSYDNDKDMFGTSFKYNTEPLNNRRFVTRDIIQDLAQ